MSTEDDILAGADPELQLSELDEEALLADDVDLKKDEFYIKEEDDLFGAAIEPTDFLEEKPEEEIEQHPVVETKPVVAAEIHKPQAVSSTYSESKHSSARKWHVYLGNMPWWTTDEDVVKTLSDFGVNDIVEVRFGENRQNGQSKGFCSVACLSEHSVKVVLDRVPGRQLNGQLLTVLPFNKQSLAKLDEPSKRLESEKKDDKTPQPQMIGQVRLGPQGVNRVNMTQKPPGPILSMNFTQPPSMMTLNPPPMNPLMQPQRVNLSAPPPMNPMINRPPPTFQQNMPPIGATHNNVNTVNAMNSVLRTRQPPSNVSSIPAGAHVNPHFNPYSAPKDVYSTHVSPEEFKEIMNRNRTVSSSAIARAMSDATAGDVSSAVETLMTAMSLIKQSKVANDEQCRALIQTLQDSLSSVEKQSGSKRRRRSRSPSERRSKHYRRSRSRSPRRHRY